MSRPDEQRIVITGLGLTAPNGNTPAEFRANLLARRWEIRWLDLRYIGRVPAGLCTYDAKRHQSRKEIRNGTRAGSIGVYCAREALADSGLDWAALDPARVGIYVGITEHGNVETENEVYNISRFGYDVKYWTHHHNPRTVANNPAGEISMNLGCTGPAYTIGAACAAGNAGLIQGAQMLLLGEVDQALAGGVSESTGTFGIFAGFKSQGALASHSDPNLASRPLDRARNGIVVSEGGALYVLERLADAKRRGARILGELAGWAINSDAKDAVLPDPERQAQCMRQALRRAGLAPAQVDIVNTHATATAQGDIQECAALREVFTGCPDTYINNTKGFIGHAMGAAGALELAGNLPALADGLVHGCANLDDLDPACALPNLVVRDAVQRPRVDTLLNNSFGMLGINSCLVVRRYST